MLVSSYQSTPMTRKAHGISLGGFLGGLPLLRWKTKLVEEARIDPIVC